MFGSNYFGSGYFGSGYFGARLVSSEHFSRSELELLDVRLELARLSPSLGVLQRILDGGIQIEDLNWREFEELLADMLHRDGYAVELGPGRNDGGKDLTAVKDMGEQGTYMAVWQAKKLKPGNKVQLNVIRELADTTAELKASKGIFATTTYLTKGALLRVRRDQYVLAKVDKDDLLSWIHRLAQRR